jgi:hypothetical protein
VLCLFTRSARLSDVDRARDNGFVSYRWDGTATNVRVIARGVLGRSWVGILRVGEKIHGNGKALRQFLDALPSEVGEVEIPVNSANEARIVRLQPSSIASRRVEYAEIRLTS